MFGGFIGDARRLGKWELRAVVVMGFDFSLLYFLKDFFCKNTPQDSGNLEIEITIFFFFSTLELLKMISQTHY